MHIKKKEKNGNVSLDTKRIWSLTYLRVKVTQEYGVQNGVNEVIVTAVTSGRCTKQYFFKYLICLFRSINLYNMKC